MTRPDSSQYAATLQSRDYSAVITAALAPLIPAGAPLAVFDFPNYSNVGDSAIWLGEEIFLAAATRSPITIVDTHHVASGTLPWLPQDTVVLISGGGNFGDLYPHHQKLRLRLLSDYRKHRVIQLPQSIHFQYDNEFARCSTALKAHADFHLLVRDHSSLEIARRLHDGTSALCPDMALCLGSLPRTVPPRYPIVALLRTDAEKAFAADDLERYGHELVVTDWRQESRTLTQHLTRHVEDLQVRYSHRLRCLYRVKRHLYHRLAAERLRRGSDILSSGHVVVTDRLHAHIMCTLMGIPHVVLDNSYRKIGNFRDAWETGTDLCRTASSFDEAMLLAREMLQ
jgi:pyruvyl transferase EpsO